MTSDVVSNTRVPSKSHVYVQHIWLTRGQLQVCTRVVVALSLYV